VDPHHYATGLRGALAVPMLTRGRLFGVLLLGERTGGEAYAPDEVEAISLFAHGVGSALDALSKRVDVSVASLQESIASMREAIIALQATIVGQADVRL
jgi:GAF domain-containing protein